MLFNKHYFSAILAFTIWGFFSMVLKPLSIYSSLDILFYRIFCAAAFLLVINVVVRPSIIKRNKAIFIALNKKQKQQTIILSLMGGLLLTLNWYFFIYALNHISIKTAAYAYLICPLLTTVLAYFILKEKLTKVQWLAVSLSLISCIILGYNQLRDLGYSLIVALSYALYLISQRKNIHFEKFFILTIQLVFSAICFLPFFPYYVTSTSYDNYFIFNIIVIALVFTIVPLWLNLYALKGVSSSTMGILLYINPLLNFTVAKIYFNEIITLNQWISYSLILLSIFIYNWHVIFKSKKPI
jgi:chloramphenicol-sensitive protein RarD